MSGAHSRKEYVVMFFVLTVLTGISEASGRGHGTKTLPPSMTLHCSCISRTSSNASVMRTADPSAAIRSHFFPHSRERGYSDQYSVRIRRKDDTVIWLEIGGAPVTDGEGNVIGSIGVHNDVTERREAEQALRDSEARYRLMAENSTDLITRTSMHGIFLYLSDASRLLLGYEPAELAGRSAYDIIYAEDRDEVRHLSKLISDVGPTTFSYRVMRKNGSLIWFETTSRSVRNPVTGVHGSRRRGTHRGTHPGRCRAGR